MNLKVFFYCGRRGGAPCQQCRMHVFKFSLSCIFIFFVGQEFKIPNRMITSIQHGKISNCSLTILYPCVLEYHFNMPIKKYYTVCCLSGILYCYLLFFQIVKNHICNKDTCTLCWCQFVAYFHSSPQKWLHRFLWSYIYK